MKKPPRDTQRSRVYRWAHKTLLTETVLSVEEVCLLTAEIADNYSIPNPVLRIGGRNVRHAYAVLPSDNVEQPAIVLPRKTPNGKWAWTTSIVAHEMSHIIIRYIYGHEGVAGHGPEFVSCFMDVLENHFGYDLEELRLSAAIYKVKWK